MNYGEVLSKAWKIIWKHKILWIFGILASCGTSSSGNSRYSNSSSQYSDGNLPPELERFFYQFQHTVSNIPSWVWILLVFVFILVMAFSILIASVGRIGLIHGTNQVEEGTEKLSFGPLFSQSMPYLGRVFLLNLGVVLIILLLILIVVLPVILLGAATEGVGFLLIAPLSCICCILIPLFLVLTVILQQADIAIVTENLGIIAGLRRSWEVVTQNLGPYVVMLLILGVLGVVANLIVSLPLILIAIPGLVGVVTDSSTLFSGGMLVSLALLCMYLPVLLAASGIIHSYTNVAWTLTFRGVTGKGGQDSPVIVEVSPTAPPEPPAPIPFEA